MTSSAAKGRLPASEAKELVPVGQGGAGKMIWVLGTTLEETPLEASRTAHAPVYVGGRP